MHKQFNNSCNNHDHRTYNDINDFDNSRTDHNISAEGPHNVEAIFQPNTCMVGGTNRL